MELWTRMTIQQYNVLGGKHEINPESGNNCTYYTSCDICGWTYHNEDGKCKTCGGSNTFVNRLNN